jgi:hypothetical protein
VGAVTLRGVHGDDLRKTAVEHIRVAVARGRETCAMVVSSTAEHLHGQAAPAQVYALAWELVPAEFAAYLAEQAGWPERTDSDRLTDAFRVLDAAGIVAREDFACCQNCGTTEIGAEVVDTARGYVFYHGQDADRAVDGDGVWLAFGLFDSPPSAEIGAEIAAALSAEGLTVNWDHSPGQRIHVPMRWGRRRHGRMAAFPAGDPQAPAVPVRFRPEQHRADPPMSAAALAELELPWLAEGGSVEVGDVVIRRERHVLVTGDGRRAGRFDGLRLLQGGDGPVPEEPGLVEVTFGNLPTGPRENAGRPMELPAVLDELRRLPTRTNSWLSAVHDAGCVQMRWEDGRLWLESPDAAEGTSTGRYATLDEAERMLTVLATEHRVAVGELSGVTTEAW